MEHSFLIADTRNYQYENPLHTGLVGVGPWGSIFANYTIVLWSRGPQRYVLLMLNNQIMDINMDPNSMEERLSFQLDR